MYNKKIIIVIPCFKVKNKILNVISQIPDWIDYIICVDDACPENSGNFIKENNSDERILTLFNDENLGVGGASMVGFKHAKIDSDNSKLMVMIKWI